LQRFAAGRVALIAALAFIAGNVASLGAPSYGALLALRLLSALAGASSWSFR
jgi:predicted MFS family arabinose efflux permease